MQSQVTKLLLSVDHNPFIVPIVSATNRELRVSRMHYPSKTGYFILEL